MSEKGDIVIRKGVRFIQVTDWSCNHQDLGVTASSPIAFFDEIPEPVVPAMRYEEV